MSEPQTSAELIQQGLVHHRAGQLSLAMDRYTQVLRNDPHNADALYYIAVVACHEGQFQQGIDLARRSLASGRGQARAHNLIGQALHRMGKIKDALESFDNAIECDANFADAYGNRANMLSELGRNAEALSSFDRALALNPNSAGDWLNRGATLQRPGAPRRRSRATTRRSRSTRDFCVPHCNRAHALLDAGRDEEALAGYDRAIALEPKMAEAYLGRALALKKLARLEEALASIDKAIEIKGDVAKMHEARASLLRSLGREDDAVATDAKAAELEARKQKTATQEAAHDAVSGQRCAAYRAADGGYDFASHRGHSLCEDGRFLVAICHSISRTRHQFPRLSRRSAHRRDCLQRCAYAGWPAAARHRRHVAAGSHPYTARLDLGRAYRFRPLARLWAQIRGRL